MSINALFITLVSYIRRPEKRRLIKYATKFRSKKGLEIGGPSSSFSLKSLFPIYLFAEQIDGVNYSNETIWEGKIKEGLNYHFYNKTGYQYIREATDLHGIADNSYDFILSCHSLEHIANPLQAIAEWKRVLKPGGLMALILPDKRYTFDRNRPYTSMDHLLSDYKQHTDESDTTHFDEILSLHDFEKDDIIKSKNELAEFVKDNFKKRGVHHHVFSFELIDEILAYFSFTKIYQQEAYPFHLITIAKKSV